MSKKSAGRPPKNLKRKEENRKGIQTAPVEEENIFELIHDNSDIYKSIFDTFNRNGTYVFMKIHKLGIQFYSSKPQHLDIVVDIYGSRVVSYYSAQDLFYKIKCVQAVQLFKIMKKKCNSIKMYINKHNLNSLKISFCTSDILETKNLDIDVITNFDINIYYSTDLNPDIVPLSFTMDWSYCKDTISRWKQFVEKNFLIQKSQSDTLRLKPPDNETDSGISIPDEPKFNVKLNDVFVAVSVPILALYNASATVLAPKLNFFISEQNYFIIRSNLDEIFLEKDTPKKDTESAVIKYFLELSK